MHAVVQLYALLNLEGKHCQHLCQHNLLLGFAYCTYLQHYTSPNEGERHRPVLPGVQRVRQVVTLQPHMPRRDLPNEGISIICISNPAVFSPCLRFM